MEVVGSGYPRVVFFQIEQSDVPLQSQSPVLAHLVVYTGLQTKVERPVDIPIVQWIIGIGTIIILGVGSNEGEYGAAFHHKSALTWVGEMVLDEDWNVDVRAVVGTFFTSDITYFKLRTVADARHDGPMACEIVVQTVADMKSDRGFFIDKFGCIAQTDIEVVLDALSLSDSRKTKQWSCA